MSRAIDVENNPLGPPCFKGERCTTLKGRTTEHEVEHIGRYSEMNDGSKADDVGQAKEG